MTTRPREVDLLRQLWRLAAESRLHCETFMQDMLELSLPQFLALRTFAATPLVPTPTYVARALGCSRANASELLSTLLRKGCVERHRDPMDKRRYCLALTSNGEDDRARGEEQLADDASLFLGALDDAELEQLLALLAKIGLPR